MIKQYIPSRIKTPIKNICGFMFDSDKRFLMLRDKGKLDKMDDRKYIEKLWKCKMGYKIDLDHPETFNEKLQWLKLHDHNPLYHILVDKIEVQKWVADRIGEEYIIPTLGVWDDPEDIDFDSLPDRFVLKCNHNSGLGMCICTDKSKLDIPAVKADLREGLAQDYFLPFREWAYKGVKPRIIAEEFIPAPGGEGLDDYKVFSSYGRPFMIEIDFDRFIEHKRNLYSLEWELLDAQIEYRNDPGRIFPRPDNLDELLSLSAKLSRDFPECRTDFYIVGDRIYFGEITFYHEAGFGRFTPIEFDKTCGEHIDLSPAGGSKYTTGE